MTRPYKEVSWNSLLKARDAFVLLMEMGFATDLDDIDGLDDINDEIDYRYKSGKTEAK